MRSLALAALALITLTSCQLRTEAPGDAPTGVAVRPGDGLVVVSWVALPELTYWIFFSRGNSVGVGNPGTIAIRRALSPRVIPGLVNGADFAFIMNATNGDSPAGPNSDPIVVAPRLAGDTPTWTSGPAIVAPPPAPPAQPQNLKSVAFSGSRFVVIGNAATIFAGDYDYTSDLRNPLNPPGVTPWQPALPLSPPLASTVNLSSAIFNGSFVALGTDSAPLATSSPVISSADGLNWVSMKPVPALGMNALGFGASLTLAPIYVAVGDQGKIFTSADPSTTSTIDWTVRDSGTPNALNSVAFLNGKFIVTGAGGILLTSSDGIQWDPQDSKTTNTLRGVAFTPLGSGVHYVAVGDGGVITNSTTTDGSDWSAITLPAQPTVPDLRSVTVGGASGTRFLAVGLGGVVVFSDDGVGLNWSIKSAGLGNTANLAKVLTAPGMYLAVGDDGANAVSR